MKESVRFNLTTLYEHSATLYALSRLAAVAVVVNGVTQFLSSPQLPTVQYVQFSFKFIISYYVKSILSYQSCTVQSDG